MKDLLQKYQDHVMDENAQKMVNQPPTDQTGFNQGHEEFLKTLIKLIEDGVLDPHLPESIYNKSIYDQLSEPEQEEASLTAVNLMSLIRQIESLWKLDQNPTFQIQNLVESVFQMKSKFEEKYGDVYII